MIPIQYLVRVRGRMSLLSNEHSEICFFELLESREQGFLKNPKAYPSLIKDIKRKINLLRENGFPPIDLILIDEALPRGFMQEITMLDCHLDLKDLLREDLQKDVDNVSPFKKIVFPETNHIRAKKPTK